MMLPPEPLSPTVSVVIVTWNAIGHTKTCIESLFEKTAYADFDVIVVDNGSTDDTLEYLRSIAGITLVECGENLGFAKGANIGIAHSKPDSDVVVVNNDIKITDPDWIGKLRRAAYSDSNVAVVGCRLVFPDGKLNHTGSFVRPYEMLGENESGLEDDIGQCTKNRKVEAVIGAVLYMKRAAIEVLGAFDEAYFAYFEDTDLCYRARKKGFEILYCGELTLEHAGSASLKENRYDFNEMYMASRKVFTARWREEILDSRELSVVWSSTLHLPVGYATATRNIIKKLWAEGVYVNYHSLYSDHSEPNTGDPLLDDVRRIPRRAGSLWVAAGPADLWKRVPSEFRVGYTMLEVDGIPREWVDAANRAVEVWVPSQFNVETFESSGVKRPIHKIPLGVDTDYFHPAITPYKKFQRFTFLSLFEWGERKGPEILIKAFNEEFSLSDDVVLVIACTNWDPAVNIRASIERLELRKKRAPIIVYVNPQLEGYQMGTLYRAADIFVLPTKGEGFGLPILEAMACGVPPIATNWSGHTEFFDESVGYPIEVQCMESAVAKCPYYEGFRWALPNLEHLRALMRRAVTNQDELRQKAAAAAERAQRYDWRITAGLIKERLKALSL
ncbi:MAG: glycosyl transferase [Acidimicrobiia bacterium]